MGKEPVGEPEGLARAVHAEIRAEMGRQKISGRDLAPRIGRGRDYVLKRIADKTTFDLNDIMRIEETFGFKPGHFVALAVKTEGDSTTLHVDPPESE